MTNSNYGEFALIKNFQPMPKRFMVWHKRGKGWLKGRSGTLVLDLVDISTELKSNPHLPSNCQLVQSTNLFDEDGEEIFEGSIVRDFDGVVGLVYYDEYEGCWSVKTNDEVDFGLDAPSLMKVMGHILQNPKLLEEK